MSRSVALRIQAFCPTYATRLPGARATVVADPGSRRISVVGLICGVVGWGWGPCALYSCMYNRVLTSKHGRQKARLTPARAAVDAGQRARLYGKVDACACACVAASVVEIDIRMYVQKPSVITHNAQRTPQRRRHCGVPIISTPVHCRPRARAAPPKGAVADHEGGTATDRRRC